MLENYGKVLEADVLVIGHGIAGLSAAISVKEENPDLKVITVDKAFAGYAGKANKGGGHVAFIPEGEEEKYVEYHSRNLGDYLNDQDMLRKYANSTVETIKRWESWGVRFTVDMEHAQNAHPVIPWKMCILDLDMMIHMAKHARKLGVESCSKISVMELLKDGNRIAGAAGIDLISGELMIFRAKSVILASGDQNFSVMNMWSSGKGDGIAAAYRAGARMRNAEFGSFVNMMTLSSRTVAYGAEDVLVNASGELCTERADMDESLKTVVGGVDLGGMQSVLMYMDVKAGKGPIYEDTSKNGFPGSFIGRNLCCYGGDADPPFYRPVAQKFWNRLYYKNRLESYRDDNPLKETVPGLIGECSPLYADHEMATSIEGLYAAGDICANGSSWSGAVPTPPGRNRGSGLMHAVFTATVAAASASKYAEESGFGIIEKDDIEHIRKTIFSSLESKGDISPSEYMMRIKEVMQPIEYSGYKSEDRLREALRKILEIKEDITRLRAADPHELNAVNECRSTILCSEMFFRASIERKESRGWHLREDYKERDDKNYLKWIEITNNNGNMVISEIPVPIESYTYRP